MQEELQEIFGEIPVLRMDADTISAAHPHEYYLDRFQKERIPILLGTQMVAKGLDFEHVTLVGVICADQSLYVEDYLAAERTFSLLTQVVGRAGRGEQTGRAVIQTYAPGDEVIRFSAQQDYDSFFAQEIALRGARGYSPYQDMTVITVSGPIETGVMRICDKLRSGLSEGFRRHGIGGQQVLGPAPAVITRVNNRYRYHLTLLGKSTPQVRRMVAHLLQAVQQDRENKGVSAFADINPMN